jgi:hypothetical protein
MKKIIWIIIAIAAVAFFFNSYIENNARREASRAKAEKIEHAIKNAVSQMASRTNAVKDWESKLSKGEYFRFEPILTVELEKLWLQQAPVLFIGSIKDIATHDQSQYVVVIERSIFGNLDHMYGTELELSLFSDKNKIDTLLEEHPDLFKDFGLKNGVAVVARINSIKTTYVAGEEGERNEVKTGHGELVDILYTGNDAY